MFVSILRLFFSVKSCFGNKHIDCFQKGKTRIYNVTENKIFIYINFKTIFKYVEYIAL